MSWTDERIDTLKRLWSEGLSASQIAGELGGISRNAVIGKVHRLKLESRIKTPATPAVAAAATATPAPVASPPVAAAQSPAPASVRQSAPAAEIRQAAPVAASTAPRILQAQTPAQSQPVARMFGATALKLEPVMEDEPTPQPTTRQSAEVVPISRNLTLVQLSERTCKWPIGDPLSDDFRFCGNHSGDGSPYCQYHARLAFQPASDRRRMR